MERTYRAASCKIFTAAPPPLRHLEVPANASFYRYLFTRAAQSKGTPDKWKTLPRYAATGAWYWL